MAKPHFFGTLKKNTTCDIRRFKLVSYKQHSSSPPPCVFGIYFWVGEKSLQRKPFVPGFGRFEILGRWPLAPLRQHLGGSREARKFIGTLVGNYLGMARGVQGKVWCEKIGGEAFEFQDGDGLGVMMVKIIWTDFCECCLKTFNGGNLG